MNNEDYSKFLKNLKKVICNPFKDWKQITLLYWVPM